MILGFTGTRRGWTVAQRAAVQQCLAALPDRVIHGGAEGADTEFDTFMMMSGMDPEDILILPGNRVRETAWLSRGRKAHRSSAPLRRNRVIVRDCDHLLATPAEMAEVLRSGTWVTIRYARKAGKPVTIVFPDGSVKEETC